MFIETDFSYGCLHTDSQKRIRKVLLFFTLQYIYRILCSSQKLYVVVCSLCGVRNLYLSLVFIEGRHENLICMSVIEWLIPVAKLEVCVKLLILRYACLI
jgi:hypothetical protein